MRAIVTIIVTDGEDGTLMDSRCTWCCDECGSHGGYTADEAEAARNAQRHNARKHRP